MRGQPRNPLLTHAARTIERLEEKDLQIATLEKDLATTNTTIAALRNRLNTKDTEVADLDTRLKALERV